MFVDYEKSIAVRAVTSAGAACLRKFAVGQRESIIIRRIINSDRTFPITMPRVRAAREDDKFPGMDATPHRAIAQGYGPTIMPTCKIKPNRRIIQRS